MTDNINEMEWKGEGGRSREEPGYVVIMSCTIACCD